MLSILIPLVLQMTHPSAAQTPRAPILINGNSEFTAANGVIAGSGTPSDPYIVEGWDIDASSANGIRIANTDANFVIRDVLVHSGGASFVGISLFNVANGWIENVTVTTSSHGIYSDSGTNLTIMGSFVFSNGGNGIYLVSSTRSAIRGTNASSNIGDGIRLTSSNGVSVDDNVMWGNGQFGVDVAFSAASMAGNNVSRNGGGIRLNFASDTAVSNSRVLHNSGVGISATSSNNVSFTDNNASWNVREGLLIDTTSLPRVEGNTIASNGRDGILISSVADATVIGNRISANNLSGVHLDSSTNGTFGRNVFVNDGLFLSGVSPDHFDSHDISVDNLVNAEPLVYQRKCSNVSFDGAPAGQVILASCAGVQLSNLTVSGTDVGVQLAFVAQASLRRNVASGDRYGVQLFRSANVTLTTTNLTGNGIGVDVESSSKIDVYHNNFVGNTAQAIDSGGIGNRWDDGYPSGGNFWSDYAGTDGCSGPLQNRCPDSDGIGDSPYPVYGSAEDRYPFVARYNPVNTPPRASFDLLPQNGNLRTVFVVNASTSSDLEDPASALEVRWDWEDDGVWDTAWSATKVASHVYSALGDYEVRLEIKDTGGLRNQTTRPLGVNNAPPAAAFIVVPGQGDVTTTFVVNASASSDLEDPASALEVRWDWEDDGVWDTAWSTTKVASHRYANAGTYRIRLETRDTLGLTSSAVRQIEVSPDMTSPQVTHVPLRTASVGEVIPISAQVFDAGGVDSVVGYYRAGGESDFRTIIMNRGGDRYEADIPPQVKAGEVSYYIIATDFAGNSARSPESGSYVIQVQQVATPFEWAPLFAALSLTTLGVVIVVVFVRRRRGKGSRRF